MFKGDLKGVVYKVLCKAFRVVLKEILGGI
jgi:hypothetical protein